MKALVLHGVGDLRYEEEWTKPNAREGWALIKIHYSGICGSDLPRTMVTGGYHHPLTCGHEFMGIVDQPGLNSHRFKGGERVTVFPLIPCMMCEGCESSNYFHCDNYNFLGSRCDGAFAEYCLAPEENLFVLPDNLDNRVGAMIEPISVALHMVRRSGFKRGESALVIGAGCIGIIVAVWLSMLGGSTVVLAGRSQESLETAKNVGFMNTIDVLDPVFADMKDFDHCYEVAGSSDALNHAMNKIRKKGVLTVLGRDTKPTNIPLAVFETFMRKEGVMKGCWGYHVPDPEKELIRESLQDSRMNLLPMVTKEIDLESGSQQIKKMFNREDYYCKVMFNLENELRT
ncbi:alcohol dehydrogenase catalytic domain-containing protein [Gammaproteobacteria bacterium]|nr:alcohol dehydrogenase catalytic domain-containing protein [Gammaproteobacteria bacterium]